MDPVRELPYGLAALIIAASEAGQMAASDQVSDQPKNHLRSGGRPQMERYGNGPRLQIDWRSGCPPVMMDTGFQVMVPRGPASLMEDSRGALCRIGRVIGTDECVHCRRAGSTSSVRPRCRAIPRTWFAIFRVLELPIARVGLEAGPLSQWIHAGLVAAGFEAVLLETRHVKAALSAMTVKTDRRDARGIAQLLRLGWYRPVHAKSASAQEVRALLTARKLIQAKLLDVESGIRGVLRGFGLKVGPISRGRFEARILELVDGHAMLETVIGSMLARTRCACRRSSSGFTVRC